MKYSLQSLMVVAMVGPPVLAGLYSLLQPLITKDLGAFIGIVGWLLVFTLLVGHAIPNFVRHP